MNENVAEALSVGFRSMLMYFTGRRQKSFEELESMLAALENSLGKQHILNAFPLFYLAITLEKADRHKEALAYNTKLLALIDDQLGVRKHPRLRQILNQRGQLLLEIWKKTLKEDRDPKVLVEAYDAASEAIEIGRKAFGAKHWQVGYAILVEAFDEHNRYPNYCLREKAWVLVEQGKHQEAEQILRQRIAALDHPTTPRSKLGSAQLSLADYLWDERRELLTLGQKVELKKLTEETIRNLNTDVMNNQKNFKRAREIRGELAEALDQAT